MADTDYLAASDGTGDAALMHVSTPRTAGATIIQVDTVAGVPAFFIGTWGTLLSTGFIDPATKRDFFGHVNAGTLVIDKMAPGNTDGGNTTGQVVVIKPSTPTQNLVGNFVKTALNNFGEGQLLNGKIVPSISTNNLVVAIKTLNGVDPSTTDVVYVRIGNTVRTITAPLSVTLAAGTNWFGKGSAPYATVSTDYFVYLGYNATDGVVLGVSSYAGALVYSDFSVTNTNWSYAKISTITNAAATDRYNNVARFNAILGVTATFLWTLPASPLASNQTLGDQLNGSALLLNAKSATNAGTITPGTGDNNFGASCQIQFTVAAPCVALVTAIVELGSAGDSEHRPEIWLNGALYHAMSGAAATISAASRPVLRSTTWAVLLPAGVNTEIAALVLGKVTA
jgi:hypothetical protein